jgi:ADP-ribosyl-[dinitrogen reductase] hydrolase
MNADKIRSVLYGVAVGDALGAPCEFQSAKDIKNLFAGFGGKVEAMLGSPDWAPGEFTDDTWLTLATCYAYSDGKFSPEVAGKNMVLWMRNVGKGIGAQTARALANLSSGRTTVFESGRKATASSGNGGAGNGSLMRCSATGIVRTDPKDIIEESKVLSEITHSDSRCVWACAAYNLILADLLAGQNKKVAVSSSWERIKQGDQETADLMRNYLDGGIPKFDVTEKHRTGFVLRSFERALRALGATNFRDAIVEIVNEGGDADTNAAIAGGLLGAKLGFDAIPKDWIDALQYRDEIEEAVKLLGEFVK